MFHMKEQHRSYRKILCLPACTGALQSRASKPLLLCSINQQYFHLTQCHQRYTAMTSRELQRCQKWFASLGWKLLPPESTFFWGRLQKAGRKRVCTAAESRAPVGSDPEQLWDNAASSCASKLLCPGAQQQVVGALRAVLQVLPSSNWGKRALPAPVKNIFLRFIPLSC